MNNAGSIFEKIAKGSEAEGKAGFKENILEGTPLERVVGKVRSKLKAMTDLNDQEIQTALLANNIKEFVKIEVSAKLPLSPEKIETLEEDAAERFASGVAYMAKSFKAGNFNNKSEFKN